MQEVLEAFTVIGSVVLLGFCLAQVGVFDASVQVLLSRLAFFIASPALMLDTLANVNPGLVLSSSLIASGVSVVLAAGGYTLYSWLFQAKPLADCVIGVMSSAYVNAGNLGLPIAAYVLGDAALIAPMLLMQLLVLQPVALMILDRLTLHRLSVGRAVLRAFSNPITLGSLLGLGLALTGTNMPPVVVAPLELVAGMAVPAVLLAFGVSLRIGGAPRSSKSWAEVTVVVAMKLVLQPLAAFVVARFLLGFQGGALLAVTLIAGLPTAQNVFLHATRYGSNTTVARNAIFASTVLSVPSMLAIVALLS
jgi:malonate transporter